MVDKIHDVKSQIDRIVANTEARMLAVVQNSLKKMVNEVQTPTQQGGKMRVVTGYLRRSGAAALNIVPTFENGKRDPIGKYKWNADSIMLIITRLKIGDVFYFGWTANYAKYREAFDGFLESGLMNWQSHVNEEVEYYRNKDMGK